MIDQNQTKNQLPNELRSVFNELDIFKHLRKAGIIKAFGFSCSYLFQLVFCLIFQHKNWFALLNSKKADCYPEKDTVYRFLNQIPATKYRRFTAVDKQIIFRKRQRVILASFVI